MFYFIEPKDFKDDPVMQLLHSCRIKPAICKFPFTYKAESHSSCLQRGDIHWCATKVDENNEPVPGYWGKCNVDEGTTDCDPSWTAPEPEPETVKDYKPMGKYLLFHQNENDKY